MARKETTTTTIDQSVLSKKDLDNTLAELQGQVESGLVSASSAAQSVAVGKVVTSPILMPNPQSLQAGMNTAATNLAAEHGDLVSQSALSGTIEQLKDAIGHSQILRSAPTNVNRDGNTMTMPSGVRDVPNRLYWFIGADRQSHYIREKADKLMGALFGGTVDMTDPINPRTEGLAGSIAIVASSRGFYRDPLVWVSQVLWENLNYDYEHDFENLDCPAFDNYLDAGVDSPILHGLRQCFDHKEVQDLSKLAKFTNKSVLAILRKIFLDECKKRNMPVPPTPKPIAKTESI